MFERRIERGPARHGLEQAGLLGQEMLGLVLISGVAAGNHEAANERIVEAVGDAGLQQPDLATGSPDVHPERRMGARMGDDIGEHVVEIGMLVEIEELGQRATDPFGRVVSEQRLGRRADIGQRALGRDDHDEIRHVLDECSKPVLGGDLVREVPIEADDQILAMITGQRLQRDQHPNRAAVVAMQGELGFGRAGSFQRGQQRVQGNGVGRATEEHADLLREQIIRGEAGQPAEGVVGEHDARIRIAVGRRPWGFHTSATGPAGGASNHDAVAGVQRDRLEQTETLGLREDVGGHGGVEAGVRPDRMHVGSIAPQVAEISAESEPDYGERPQLRLFPTLPRYIPRP